MEPDICPILSLAIYFAVVGFSKTALVRYEAAGDRVVGRFVAGLPYETPDFAILPPFFDTVDDNVRNGINICYPNAPDRF
ncbi:hypothetical protein JG687_00018270 [Phytophthora cactorum]|uniref:Uncharacterized protein n=1 Tax=Phytophthora cactorum TaxID=29920 RepID=A0A8T1TR22_9STRA|nr:hypothetical protein JG687_00018270 [Phytophthora cactorum]